MNEPRKAGRPRKHPAQDIHLKTEQQVREEESLAPDSSDEAVDENPPVMNSENVVSGKEPSADTAEITLDEPESTKGTPEGWFPIESALHNGLPIYVSDDGVRQVLVFWKRTRAFANATHKWEERGKWCESVTGFDLPFEPKFWRPR